MKCKEDDLGGGGDVRYKPVMEIFQDDSVDSNLGQDYKSPIKSVKHYGRSGDSFLSRMKIRNSREQRTVVDANDVIKASKLKASKKKQKATASSTSASDLFEDLECSQDMKKFIKDEYTRERALYPFLPDSQIASAIVHRFRTHIANSGVRVKRAEVESRKNVRRSPLKLSGSRNRKKASVDTDDNSEDDEVKISDFEDDGNFNIPHSGSFSLTPSTSQLKLSKNILMRFASDNDSFEISDSSQESTNSLSKRKATPSRRTPVKKRKSEKANGDESEDFKVLEKDDSSDLPVLVSPSISDGISLFHSQEEEDAGQKDLVLRLGKGITCGTCRVHITPTLDGEDSLKICSGCRTIAYCSRACQRKSWPRHKRLCKRLGKLSEEKKMEIIAKEVNWEDKKISEARAKEAKALEKAKSKVQSRNLRKLPSRKGVTINSQPEFAPSNEEILDMDVQTRSPAKSILKKSSGLHISVVLNSPPIKSRAQTSTEGRANPDPRSPESTIQSASDDPAPDVPGDGTTVKSNLLSQLTSSGRGSKGSLSEETFQDVLKQMEVIHSPEQQSKPNDVTEDIHHLEAKDDEVLKKMEEMHRSPSEDRFTLACLPPREREDSAGPQDNLDSSSSSSRDDKSNCQAISTPVNSPGLLGEITNKSLSRPSSRRTGFPRRATPYPLKSLDLEQTEEVEDSVLRKKLDFTSGIDEDPEEMDPAKLENDDDVKRKLDFEATFDEDDRTVRADARHKEQDPEEDCDEDVMTSASAASSGQEEVPQSSLGRQAESPVFISRSPQLEDVNVTVASFQVILISAVCLNVIASHLILLLLLFRF